MPLLRVLPCPSIKNRIIGFDVGNCTILEQASGNQPTQRQELDTNTVIGR